MHVAPASGAIPNIAAMVRKFPVTKSGGLGIRLVVQCEGAQAELELGDAARFHPSNAALAEWKLQPSTSPAVIEYE